MRNLNIVESLLVMRSHNLKLFTSSDCLPLPLSSEMPETIWLVMMMLQGKIELLKTLMALVSSNGAGICTSFSATSFDASNTSCCQG